MSNSGPPHLFLVNGLREGHDLQTLKNAQKRMRLIENSDAKPVLTLRHLAQLTGSDYNFLRLVVSRSAYPYKTFAIPKRSKGKRTITAPLDELKIVQRWILDHVLATVRVHPSSFAYASNRSIVHCARQHIGARWTVKLDIEDFFGSISERAIYSVFRSKGYSALVSFELSRLCTIGPVQGVSPYAVQKYSTIRTYAATRLGHLPQGAPTSGALANAVALQLDVALNKLALDNGFIYTRYSDDITLSTAVDCGRQAASEILSQAQRIIWQNSFQPQRRKARIVPPGARQVILGLMVTDETVRLLPEFRRNISFHIHAVEKHGLQRHVDSRGFRSGWSFINHIDGLLAFASSVEPDWALKSTARWVSALKN